MTDRRFIHQHNLNHDGKLLRVTCRFCHATNDFDRYKHIAPCGCAGNTRYVHKRCFTRWVTVKFEDVYNDTSSDHPEKFNVFCEVCQQRMQIEFTTSTKCNTYDGFLEQLNGHRVLFAFLLLFGLMSLVGIIVLSILASRSEQIETALIVGIAVLCVTLVTVVIIFIVKYLLKKTIDLTKIPNNKQQPQILGFQKSMNEIQEARQDPYFGQIDNRKNQRQPEPSLMIESRISSKDRNSQVSNTLTDYVMRKMYKHDWTNNQNSVMREEPQQQRPNFLKQEMGVEKSIEPTKKDQAIQNSVMSSRRSRKKIFDSDPSIAPESSIQKDPPTPIFRSPQKQFKSQMMEMQVGQFRPEIDSRDSRGTDKRSDDHLQLAEKENNGVSRLKLKGSRDPIKIKVLS